MCYPSRACVGARDPYCGWDLLLKKCTTLEESVRMSQWEQSITKCPVSVTQRLSDPFTHLIAVHLLVTHFLCCLHCETLKLVDYSIILTRPSRSLSPPHGFNTPIHRCSSLLKAVPTLYSYHTFTNRQHSLKPAGETYLR